MVKNHVQIANGYDNSRFKQFVFEAQTIDFKPLVCPEFYCWLLENYTTANDLMKGGSYTYDTDKKDVHDGLEKVLAYFIYARYCWASPVVSTSHGRVQKETPYSSPVSNTQRKDDYHYYRNIAECAWNDVRRYIERNEALYPEYFACNSGCEPINRKRKTFTLG